MLPRNDVTRFFVIVLIFLTLFCTTLFAAKLPIFGKVPEFSFVDQNGKPFSNSDLKGKVWIADFIFTRCQGMCPLITGKMAGLQDKLKAQDIKLVSFSVDPEHDTSEVLSKYAVSHKAISGKWFFITTNQKQTMWDFIMSGFMLGVGESTPEDLKQGAEPVMHSSRFVLVDQDGNIRGYYDSEDAEKMEKLAEDAQNVEKESH